MSLHGTLPGGAGLAEAPQDTASGGAGARSRPRTVTGAVLLAGVAGLAMLVNAIVALADGKSMLRHMADSLVGGSIDALGGDATQIMNDAVDSAYKTLQSRAYIWIALAVVYVLLAFAVRAGRGWARIVTTLFVFVPAIVAMVDVRDATPTFMHALDGIDLVCGVALIVMLWLPPTNAYLRDRKAAR